MKTIRKLEFQDYEGPEHTCEGWGGRVSHVTEVSRTDEWFLDDQYIISYWKEQKYYTACIDTQRRVESKLPNIFAEYNTHSGFETLQSAKQACQDDFEDVVQQYFEEGNE